VRDLERNILPDDPELKTKGIGVTIFTKMGRLERKCDVVCPLGNDPIPTGGFLVPGRAALASPK
jgi:hypothetical protein